MPPPAATQAAARLWTVRVARSVSSLFLMTSVASIMRVHDTPAVKTRFTRGCVRELKNAHNSVTVQNWTQVYMNFFDHRNLGNHLLQLCPKVVKHPVYIYLQAHHYSSREILDRWAVWDVPRNCVTAHVQFCLEWCARSWSSKETLHQYNRTYSSY